MSSQVDQGELLALLEDLGNQQSKHACPDCPRLLINQQTHLHLESENCIGKDEANSFGRNSSPRLGNIQ